MRYIFLIQGEGRGHMTQAIAMANILRKHGHQVAEVMVGRCKNRELPLFFSNAIGAPITQYDSPTFDYGQGGKRGRVIKTLIQNTTPSKLNRWRRSLSIIEERIKESKAEVVINFYETLLGWASMFGMVEIPIISIGHQFLIDHPQFVNHAERAGGAVALRLTNMICSYGSHKRLALSFYPMERSLSRRIEVVPPLLRSELFELEITQGDYMLGYMLNPAYLKEVVEWKSRNPDTKVHLFWDKVGAAECDQVMPNLWVHRINDVEFLRLMAGSQGYITTAGFESICEALYLGKPTVMIPAHVEQQINAADAHSVGAGLIAQEFNLSLLSDAIDNYQADTEKFRGWIKSAETIFIKALTEL